MDRHSDDFFSRAVVRLAEELAPRIAAELARFSAWIDQRDSPLGRNTHCDAVRRRMAEERANPELEPSAGICPGRHGRRYMLSPAALRQEMRCGRSSVARRAKKDPDPPPDPFEELLDAELRNLREEDDDDE